VSGPLVAPGGLALVTQPNTFTKTQTLTPAVASDMGLVLNAKDQQNYTEPDNATGRPVIHDLNYVAAPSSAPGIPVDYHGIDLVLSASSNVNANTGLYPLESEALYSGAGTVGRVIGAYLRSDNTGAGTVSGDLTPLQTRGTNTGGGTVAEYRGLYLRVPDNTGSTITLLKGLYLDDMTAAGGQSFHKGAIGIGPGATTPAAMLHIRPALDADVAMQVQLTATPAGDVFRLVDNTNTTRLLTIDKAGQLGFGVATPLAPIHAKAASAASDVFFVEASGSGAKRVVMREDGSVGLGLNYPTQSLNAVRLQVEFNAAGIQRNLSLTNSHTLANGDGVTIEGVMNGNIWGQLQNVVDATSGAPGSSWRLRVRDNSFVLAERFRVDGNGVGFNGSTPIAKPTFAAAATDLATVITLANDLRARLISYGLGA
jgi:hypothetical protein